MLELAWWIWVLVLYSFGIMFAIDALWQGRTAQGTIAWVLALLLMPVVSIPMYVFFGSRRFHGYLRARRHDDPELGKVADQLIAALQPHNLPPDAITQPFYSLFRLPNVSGNRCTLLKTGQETYQQINDSIRTAKHYVCVQFYILRCDASGEALADALCEKARQGVPCYLLYDEIGSQGIRKDYINRLTEAGVHLSQFNQLRFRTRAQLNFRNHRKLVICDSKVAFVGGYNVGDEYQGTGEPLPFWRDTHVKIEGPGALTFQLAFTEDWHWATGTIPPLPAQTATEQGDCNIMCIPTGPADDTESASLFFSHLIHKAQKRCWLVSPYFVPDQNIIATLQLAGLRGVDVRVLIPKTSDNFFVQHATPNYVRILQNKQVKFFSYAKGFLHQKVLLVDDEWTCIGSANLDNRSLRINFEINALIQCHPFAKQVEAMLVDDFNHAEPTVLDNRWWKKMLSKTARLLSPLL